MVKPGAGPPRSRTWTGTFGLSRTSCRINCSICFPRVLCTFFISLEWPSSLWLRFRLHYLLVTFISFHNMNCKCECICPRKAIFPRWGEEVRVWLAPSKHGPQWFLPPGPHILCNPPLCTWAGLSDSQIEHGRRIAMWDITSEIRLCEDWLLYWTYSLLFFRGCFIQD